MTLFSEWSSIHAICDSKEIWVEKSATPFGKFIHEVQSLGHEVQMVEDPHFGEVALFMEPHHDRLPDWSRFFQLLEKFNATLMVPRRMLEDASGHQHNLVFNEISTIIPRPQDVAQEIVSPLLWRSLTGLSIVQHHRTMTKKYLSTVAVMDGEPASFAQFAEYAGMLTRSYIDLASDQEVGELLEQLSFIAELAQKWRHMITLLQSKERRLVYHRTPFDIGPEGKDEMLQGMLRTHAWMHDYRTWTEIKASNFRMMIPRQLSERQVMEHLNAMNRMLKSLNGALLRTRNILDRCPTSTRKRVMSRLKTKLRSWFDKSTE